MTVDMPEIQIDVQMIVCARHGEPFRKGWPKGFAALTILVVELIQSDEALGAEAAEITAERPGPGYMAALRRRPACERVDAERLRRLYLESGIAVDGICVVCGRRSPGTEFQRSVPRRLMKPKVVTDRHVCFECVLTRMTPATDR